MSNEDKMAEYNARAGALCIRVQDQIQEGDTLDIVMEMVSFMAASTGLQIIEEGTAIPDLETFLTHLANAVVNRMGDLEELEKDKLTGGNYVQ